MRKIVCRIYRILPVVSYSSARPHICSLNISRWFPVIVHRPSLCGLYFQLSLHAVDREWSAGPPHHVRILVRTVCPPLSVCLFLCSPPNARLYTYIYYIHTHGHLHTPCCHHSTQKLEKRHHIAP